MDEQGLGDALAALLAGRDPDPDPAPAPRDALGCAVATTTAFWQGRHAATTALAAGVVAGADGPVDDLLVAACFGLAVAGDPAAAGLERWDTPDVQRTAGTGAHGRRVSFARYLFAEAALACARLDVAARTLAGGAWHEPWADHPYEVMMLATAVRTAAFCGRIDEAAVLLDRAHAVAGRHGLEHLTSAVAVLVDGNADRAEQTRRTVERMLAAEGAPRDHLGRGVHLLAAFGAVAIGDVHSAASLVLTAATDGFERLTIVDRALSIELLVAAAEADGDADAAAVWLETATDIAGHRAARPALDRSRARLAGLLGDWDAAARHAADAVRAAREDGRGIEAAEGEIVLARAQIRRREVRDASRTLRNRVVEADAAGHHAVRRSATQVLSRAGRRLPPVSAGGWAVLSDREREIADHVLAGGSQRDIASALHLAPGTVRAHTARVLRAFGVGSRVALLAAQGPRGAPPPVPVVDLTTRQSEVVALLADGRSNAEIARVLAISVKSVEKHVGDALARWQSPSRFELARTWLCHGATPG